MTAVFQGAFDSLPVSPRLLTLLCGAYAAYQTRRLLDFVWFYCLRPSSAHRYIHGPAPYALVTGASDGIGKAIAHELYDHGFNLILHGRNEEKLRKVADEIRARGDRVAPYSILLLVIIDTPLPCLTETSSGCARSAQLCIVRKRALKSTVLPPAVTRCTLFSPP